MPTLSKNSARLSPKSWISNGNPLNLMNNQGLFKSEWPWKLELRIWDRQWSIFQEWDKCTIELICEPDLPGGPGIIRAQYAIGTLESCIVWELNLAMSLWFSEARARTVSWNPLITDLQAKEYACKSTICDSLPFLPNFQEWPSPTLVNSIEPDSSKAALWTFIHMYCIQEKGVVRPNSVGKPAISVCRRRGWYTR